MLCGKKKKTETYSSESSPTHDFIPTPILKWVPCCCSTQLKCLNRVYVETMPVDKDELMYEKYMDKDVPMDVDVNDAEDVTMKDVVFLLGKCYQNLNL